jgi:hypothetical protein
MTPDPEWQARLEQASDKFGELKQKAAEKMSGITSPNESPDGFPDDVPSEETTSEEPVTSPDAHANGNPPG